jgi:L-rhamnose mutarotase
LTPHLPPLTLGTVTRRRQIALTLNLKDDPSLQAAYRRHHDEVPPDIEASLREAGILRLHIHALGTRLVMLLEVDDDFSFERKARLDAANPAVQEWGAADVDLPGPPAPGGSGREMGRHGRYLRLRYGLVVLTLLHQADR